MQETNRLSDNLKSFQKERGSNLKEFSAELGIPKSTLQSVLQDGNTTLETLLRIQSALGISLDALVFGDPEDPSKDQVRAIMECASLYSQLAPGKQKEFHFYMNKLVELFQKD